jgi:hypothetical protein
MLVPRGQLPHVRSFLSTTTIAIPVSDTVPRYSIYHLLLEGNEAAHP